MLWIHFIPEFLSQLSRNDEQLSGNGRLRNRRIRGEGLDLLRERRFVLLDQRLLDRGERVEPRRVAQRPTNGTKS